MKWIATYLLFCVLLLPVEGEEPSPCDLVRDLMTINYWEQQEKQTLPVSNNHFLYGGYFAMPSARMGQSGELGIGYASVPPYNIYSFRWQILSRFELSANYRIFRGVEDPILSPHGFGDFSDKGANVKLALLTPEETNYVLPGFAIGWEDFLGTRSFEAQYVVMTYVCPRKAFEISLGYGAKHIRGIFGGISWMPFHHSCMPYLKTLRLEAEYDATPYHDKNVEPHPKGRVQKTPINFGLKYRLWDLFDFSVSYIRGDALAASVSLQYNLGATRGFLPKIHDTLPYTAPVNVEPLGTLRTPDLLVQDLLFALREQGFDLLKIYLEKGECCQKRLRIVLLNLRYQWETDLRCRLNRLLASLIPQDIDQVWVTVSDQALPIQEYRFEMEDVRAFAAKKISPYELNVLSPLHEVSYPDAFCVQHLYERRQTTWNVELFPKVRTFFGSAKGKFKYLLGLNLGINGFLYPDIFYSVRLGYAPLSDLEGVGDVDLLNPSQLINVRTDTVRYYRKKEITLDEGYLQKSWNFTHGWYGRLAAGYFEEAYGGTAAEVLYYPVHSNFAFGAEGALVKKRKYSGLGFEKQIRKFEGTNPTFVRFHGSQYFFNFYYHWKQCQLDLSLKAGQFLAKDIGIRYELTRYYASGLRISLWYTRTNGKDKVNGETYYDKGIALSLPLDIFYTHSERSRTGYGMSAWLRDVGAIARTGNELYPLIRDLRY